MHAKDIMSTDIVSVDPESSVLDAAAALVRERVSALLVVDAGAVVGILSEADLLHRYELGTQRDPAGRAWWRRLLDGDSGSSSYVEAHAMKVRDIMTPRVVSITADMPVTQVVALFEKHKIKQAPVLEGAAVVGVVSRADFVRALLARAGQGRKAHPHGDAAIRRALRAELEAQPWWRAERSTLTVVDGIVHFSGEIDSIDEKAAARVAAENIAGVRGVEDSRSLSIPAAGYPASGYL